MKAIPKFLFVSILLSFTLFSCNKSATAIITNGTWFVSMYMDDNKDETSDFTGYVFDFKSSGSLSVTTGSGATVFGTWNYDNNALKYNIFISGTGALDKIKGGWVIISKSKTLLQLRDDDPSKNNMLNFKKR